MITGIIQTTKTNDWGFTSYKVSSTWYGADSKGPARASEGEKVTFEAFDKPGKDGKVWPTIKLATFKKISNVTADAASNQSMGSSSGGSTQRSAGTKDSYWTDKAQEDAKKDPRIVYQSSYERALIFVDLAIKNGAFEALGKAKPNGKLEVLQAFVDEQAARIMKAVYAAQVPGKDSTTSAQVGTDLPTTDLEESPAEESWS